MCGCVGLARRVMLSVVVVGAREDDVRAHVWYYVGDLFYLCGGRLSDVSGDVFSCYNDIERVVGY